MRQTKADRTHIWYLYTVHLDRDRDGVNDRLRARGIGSSVYWRTPVNRMELYRNLGHGAEELPGVYDAVDHVLSLPVHPEVTEEEVGYIASELGKAIRSG